jgi:hypothetical protein
MTIHPTSAASLHLLWITRRGSFAAVTVLYARRYQSVNNLERTKSNAILTLRCRHQGLLASGYTAPAHQQGNLDITSRIIVHIVQPLRNVGQDRLCNAAQSCTWTGSE